METTALNNQNKPDFENFNRLPMREKNEAIIRIQQDTGKSAWTVLSWIAGRTPVPHWHIDRVTEIINQALEQANKAAMEPQHQ